MHTTRVIGFVLALVGCAWFGLGLLQADDIAKVNSIVGGLNGQRRLSGSEARHADSLLRTARVLNPDEQVDVLRARIALLRGERRQAKQILLSVLHREPDNLAAWYGLATSASDEPTVLHALHEIALLAPHKRPAP